MIALNLGKKNVNNKYMEALVKKNALMYLSLYPKDLHYQNMEKYIRNNYNINTNLYSICYYIIARSSINRSDNNYSVIISPQDEFLYNFITYGNRDIRGIDIINKALTTFK